MRLTTDALDSWIRDGWLLFPGVVDAATLADLHAALDDLTGWASSGGPGLHHFEQTVTGPALARSERFADVHPMLGSFVRSGIVADVVASLLGNNAALFKEKVNYKQPGGAGFAPHQDAAAYRFVDHHISVMVPLDPATLDSGCLWFARGHHHGRLDTDDRGRLRDHVVAALDWESIEVQPGDIIAFDSYAPHRSDTNRATHPRRALYLTYNDSTLGDFRDRYYADKEEEFENGGAAFESGRARISISDDFLGLPVR